MSQFIGLLPGQYDLPEDDYHADPCAEPSASRSFLKTMLDASPRHAWMTHPRLNPMVVAEHKPAYDLGSAAHKLVLGAGAEITIVDAKDWRTKAAKEARDEAYANGTTPMLEHEYAGAKQMAEACKIQLKHHPEARGALENGKAEQTLIWKYGNVWCRCMIDYLPEGGNVIYDYKTTGQSAHPDEFQRSIFNYGYDLQAAFYSMGLREILGIENAQFRFIVQETKPPYAINVMQLGPEALDLATQRVKHGLNTFQWCMENNRWPAYPGEVCYIDAPVWYSMRFEDNKVRNEVAQEGGKNLLETMVEWQAPSSKLAKA